MTSKFNPKSVISVYSGRDGKCCCGCAGKHYYASAFVEEASKSRGYAVSEDEVSDRMVARVTKIVSEAVDVSDDGGNCFSAVVGNRVYIVYTNDVAVQ